MMNYKSYWLMQGYLLHTLLFRLCSPQMPRVAVHLKQTYILGGVCLFDLLVRLLVLHLPKRNLNSLWKVEKKKKSGIISSMDLLLYPSLQKLKHIVGFEMNHPEWCRPCSHCFASSNVLAWALRCILAKQVWIHSLGGDTVFFFFLFF